MRTQTYHVHTQVKACIDLCAYIAEDAFLRALFVYEFNGRWLYKQNATYRLDQHDSTRLNCYYIIRIDTYCIYSVGGYILAVFDVCVYTYVNNFYCIEVCIYTIYTFMLWQNTRTFEYLFAFANANVFADLCAATIYYHLSAPVCISMYLMAILHLHICV